MRNLRLRHLAVAIFTLLLVQCDGPCDETTTEVQTHRTVEMSSSEYRMSVSIGGPIASGQETSSPEHKLEVALPMNPQGGSHD